MDEKTLDNPDTAGARSQLDDNDEFRPCQVISFTPEETRDMLDDIKVRRQAIIREHRKSNPMAFWGMGDGDDAV